MTYKVPMYYIVKVQYGRTAYNQIVKDVEYLAGPYGSRDSNLLEDKLHFESKNFNDNIYIDVATQYIEVEL